MPEEFLACFDREGNMVQPHARSEALTQPFPCYYHAVVNVWLIDKAMRMLCSKRSKLVKANAEKWQTYFGGHVPANHTFEDTLTKELQEEIGLTIHASDAILIDEGIYEPHKHLYKSYVVLFDPHKQIINFTDGEISATKWMTFTEYITDHGAHADTWCNGIELHTQDKIKQLIKT